MANKIDIAGAFCLRSNIAKIASRSRPKHTLPPHHSDRPTTKNPADPSIAPTLLDLVQ
ncbi:MAG: hypothetical protein HC795_09730 [Coleofasciculaceae cyanobacterium RL_1_1]|nr:hypothetical protein [Coleofasciculaceae cyanobacterium RL_1_1]